MEEVRRELIKQFGEAPENGPNSLYARRPVGPQLDDPDDAGRGRAGASRRPGQLRRLAAGPTLGMTLNLDQDWAAALDRAPVGTGYPDWRKAVVLDKSGGSRDDRLHQRLARHSAGLRGLNAEARRRRRGLQLPEAGHGHHRQADRRPAAMHCDRCPRSRAECWPRKCTPAGSSPCRAASTSSARRYNRATQALRQPGSAFKPIVYVDRAGERLHAGHDRARCPVLRLAGRRASATNASSTSTTARPARTRCAGASSSRAT